MKSVPAQRLLVAAKQGRRGEEMEVASLRCSVILPSPSSLQGPTTRITKASNVETHHRFKLSPTVRHPTRIRSSKDSNFQDFGSFANPVRLLPASEPVACSGNSLEQAVGSFDSDGSRSLVKVKIQTSNMYGSALSDTNAGVIFILIDEKGNAVLQRIPSVLKSASGGNDSLLFERGSVDEFAFEVPEFWRVEALWLGVQSGQWRVSGVSVTIIGAIQLLEEETEGQKTQYSIFHYEFKEDDVLLGGRNDSSLIELRPALVSEASGDDLLSLLSRTPAGPISSLAPGRRISIQESMREYKDLKASLLLYDVVLVAIGTLSANFLFGEDAAIGFFVGGVVGFSYLLLIQRSVDALPSSPSGDGNDRLFGGFGRPITCLALAIGLTFIAAKYSAGDASSLVLTPTEVLAGLVGFLACIIAVVIAAINPMSMNSRRNE